MEVVRQLPPGFRFHPTDEELVVQYLRRKALARPLPAAVIPVVHDAGELDPWDLPGASEGEAYFFSLRRRAAPARGGGYRRRRTASGYWKATGKEKPVFLQCCGSGSKRLLLVGVKTALAFHRAKPPSPSPSSSRTGWVMHEYRLAAPGAAPPPAEQKKSAHHSFVAQAEEWVVCRIFLKNKPTSRRHHGEVDGQTPGSSGAAHDDVHRSPLSGLPPPSSSSSCVTGISDEDEVSSGSSISPATVASQRETGES